jgi:ribonuclease P protein component
MAVRLDAIPAGTDVVVRANPVAAQANSAMLGSALDSLLPRVTTRLTAVRS